MLDTDQMKYGLFRFLSADMNIDLSMSRPSREEFDAIKQMFSLQEPLPEGHGPVVTMSDYKNKPQDAEVTVKLTGVEGSTIRWALRLYEFMAFTSMKKPVDWDPDCF